MAMQLTQSVHLRMEQRQLLTPRMIQSMEILQLPLMALEERIEQEMQNNPVLELRDGATGAENETTSEEPLDGDAAENARGQSEEERPMVVKENDDAADFDRLAKISEYLENEEFSTNGSSFRQGQASYDGERDKKMDAMNNTAARGVTLQEHLLNQWAFIETPPGIKAAGEAIINYITAEGYLKTDLEQIQRESKKPLAMEDLQQALKLVQALEPAGV